MEFEIACKEKFYAYISCRVYAGRYVGEPIASTKDKRHWAIKDLHLCQMNVAKFIVKDYKTYFRFGIAYSEARTQIVWRDGTESWIMLPAADLKYISKALKHEKTPYQTILT